MAAESLAVLLAEYRRMIEDETYRSPREHELYRLLLSYPQLTRMRMAKPSAAALLEGIGQRQVRKWIVGMTSPEEQAYCEWFASHLYRGTGEWLELGCFLGSLTIPSAHGLEANPRPATKSRKIRVFNLFRWDEIMTSSVKGTPFEGCRQVGESYFDLYKETVADVISRLEVTETDLTAYCYSGEPIEFLMVDVMKSEALVANVLQQFFGKVLPGDGYVFHQDYLHCVEGWITLCMYNLREYYTPVCEVQDSGAVVFRCTKAVPESKLTFPLQSTGISPEWIEAAFAWSCSVISEARHHEIAATKVMMLIHCKRLEEAARLYRDGLRKYPQSYAFVWLLEHLKNIERLELLEDGSFAPISDPSTLTNPDDLWEGSTSLAPNWKWLRWFGCFNTEQRPWILHAQHGWLYPFGADTKGIYFWDADMKAFWWTSASDFPTVYRFSDSAWLRYLPGSVHPRLFYNIAQEKWESWESSGKPTDEPPAGGSGGQKT